MRVEDEKARTFYLDEAVKCGWSSRELGSALEYSQWENFYNVIKRAMIACENSGHRISADFPDLRKIGSL